MNRLGLLHPTSLNAEQKELYDTFTDYTSRKYGDKFTTKLPNECLVGPFGIQLHTPAVGRHFLGLAKELAVIPGLPPNAREVAILVVGSRMHAAYEHYAHARLSGFTEKQLEDIRQGICPVEFDEKQKVAFLTATELGKPGSMSGEAWNKAKDVLGIQGAMALVHYVGFYSYVSTILNGFDAQVPE